MIYNRLERHIANNTVDVVKDVISDGMNIAEGDSKGQHKDINDIYTDYMAIDNSLVCTNYNGPRVNNRQASKGIISTDRQANNKQVSNERVVNLKLLILISDVVNVIVVNSFSSHVDSQNFNHDEKRTIEKE